MVKRDYVKLSKKTLTEVLKNNPVREYRSQEKATCE